MIDRNQFRGSILLCDSAQVQGGKLYLLGGGWSRIVRLQVPLNMAIAVRLLVPWHETNKKHDLKIALLDADNKPVRPKLPELPPDEAGFEIRGNFEAGRPPGISQGSFLDSPIALNFQIDLEPGDYVWELAVNGHPLDHYPFGVVSPEALGLQVQV